MIYDWNVAWIGCERLGKSCKYKTYPNQHKRWLSNIWKSNLIVWFMFSNFVYGNLDACSIYSDIFVLILTYAYSACYCKTDSTMKKRVYQGSTIAGSGYSQYMQSYLQVLKLIHNDLHYFFQVDSLRKHIKACGLSKKIELVITSPLLRYMSRHKCFIDMQYEILSLFSFVNS